MRTGVDHGCQGDLALLGALVLHVVGAPRLRYPVPVVEHGHVVEHRQVLRIDDLEQAQRPALEHHLQHLVFPPAPGMLHRIGLVALLAQVGRGDDLAPRVDLVRLDLVAELVAHDVKEKASFCVGLVHDQGAHPADAVVAQLLVGHQGLRHRCLGHGEVDVPVEPVGRALQAVAVVLEFQLGRLEQVWVARGPHHHAGQRLDLPRQLVHVHEFGQVQRRVYPLPRVVGRGHGQRLLAHEGRRLASETQGNRHVVLPGALGRGQSLHMPRGVGEDLLDRQTQPLRVGRQHELDIVVSRPLGVVEGAHAKGGGPSLVARQIEREHQVEVDALVFGHALPEVLAATAVAVEEVVDTGQSLEVRRSGQEEHRIVRPVLREHLGQVEQGDDARCILGARGQGRHHRDGVVVRLDDDHLFVPLLGLLAALFRQPFPRTGQPAVEVAPFYLFPVHARRGGGRYRSIVQGS